MVVLRAIGNFFKKIWDWIKQTAWIQPLLIVGVIFGVIFSIPSIVDAIKDARTKALKSEVFYTNYRYSLEGEENSKADEITNKIYEISHDTMTYEESNIEFDKFFLVYVAEECPECKECKGGFEKLANQMDKKVNGKIIYDALDDKPFNMVTIYADEETSFEDDKNETPFVRYLNRNDQFLLESAGVAYETDYYFNGKVNDQDLENMEAVDADLFLTPTILLVELNPETGAKGVTEVMFGVEGSTDGERAQTLLDCWNHKGDFCKEGKK